MTITISGREQAVAITAEKPKFYNSVVICSDRTLAKEGFHRNLTKQIVKQSKTAVYLAFDDIVKVLEGYRAVTPKDIQKVLRFAEHKENLLCACAAGISRSSSIAYVIARSRLPYEEAIKVLDPEGHWPNSRVIQCGEAILKLPLCDEIDAWKAKLNSKILSLKAIMEKK